MARKSDIPEQAQDFEIITSDENINNIANDYIHTRNVNVKQSTGFLTMLRYIYNTYIKDLKIPLEDINTLDYYYNIYIELCSCCNIQPFVKSFTILCNLNYNTVESWRKGEARSRTHSQIVKKWFEFSENAILTDAGKNNVGSIFLAKALFGYSENNGTQMLLQQNNLYQLNVSKSDMMQNLGIKKSDNFTIESK